MSAKKAKGANPLDALLDQPGVKHEQPEQEAAASAKAKASFNLSGEVLELARDAAWWTRLSLSELVEEAIRREVARLAKREGHAAGFPPRRAQLKPGRSTK